VFPESAVLPYWTKAESPAYNDRLKHVPNQRRLRPRMGLRQQSGRNLRPRRSSDDVHPCNGGPTAFPLGEAGCWNHLIGHVLLNSDMLSAWAPSAASLTIHVCIRRSNAHP